MKKIIIISLILIICLFPIFAQSKQIITTSYGEQIIVNIPQTTEELVEAYLLFVKLYYESEHDLQIMIQKCQDANNTILELNKTIDELIYNNHNLQLLLLDKKPQLFSHSVYAGSGYNLNNFNIVYCLGYQISLFELFNVQIILQYPLQINLLLGYNF